MMTVISNRPEHDLWHDIEFSRFVLGDVDKNPIDAWWDHRTKKGRLRTLARSIVELDRRQRCNKM